MRLTTFVLLVSSAMLTVPVMSAWAQPNPTGNYGSNRSETASGRTADRAPGLKTGDVTKNGHNPGMTHNTTQGTASSNPVPSATRQAQTTGGPGR
ncbi:MAG: hypothetical protein INR62_06710 [Rhodospirillales bacterium]|nr:hypothetical protein [Acetobacter sp.]